MMSNCTPQVYECKEKKGVYLDCQTPHTIGTGGIPEGDKILAPKEPLVKPTLSSLGEGGSKSPKQSSNPSSKAFTPNKLHHRVPGRGQTIDRSSNPILNLFRSYKSKPKVPIIKRDKIELFLGSNEGVLIMGGRNNEAKTELKPHKGQFNQYTDKQEQVKGPERLNGTNGKLGPP